MGNHWSGPHPWPSQRKTSVEACWKSPARVCPRCGRAVRFLYAPFNFGPFRFSPVFVEPPEPTKEEWACRVCHGLVYSSQYPKCWENDHKRTFAAKMEQIRQFRDAFDRRQARAWKRYEKALKEMQKASVKADFDKSEI